MAPISKTHVPIWVQQIWCVCPFLMLHHYTTSEFQRVFTSEIDEYNAARSNVCHVPARGNPSYSRSRLRAPFLTNLVTTFDSWRDNEVSVVTIKTTTWTVDKTGTKCKMFRWKTCLVRLCCRFAKHFKLKTAISLLRVFKPGFSMLHFFSWFYASTERSHFFHNCGCYFPFQ